MSISSVLERLKAKKTVELQSEWKQYRSRILGPLSANEEVDCDEVELFLTKLGKSESDLRSDVEKLHRRLSLRQQMELARENRKRLESLEPQIEKLDREFARVREEYLAKVSPLRSEASRLGAMADPESYANDLRRTVLDQSIVHGLASIAEKRRDIAPRTEWLRNELHRNANEGTATVKYWISKTEDEIAELEGPSAIRRLGDSLLAHATGDRSEFEKKAKVSELRLRLKELLSVRSRYEAELGDLERQHAALLAEERDLHEKSLEP